MRKSKIFKTIFEFIDFVVDLSITKDDKLALFIQASKFFKKQDKNKMGDVAQETTLANNNDEVNTSGENELIIDDDDTGENFG